MMVQQIGGVHGYGQTTGKLDIGPPARQTNIIRHKRDYLFLFL